MSNAEKYLMEHIPTMVGENHVSSMKLSTMISLLNGFHESELKKKAKPIINDKESFPGDSYFDDYYGR
jgi:hypothetical protein